METNKVNKGINSTKQIWQRVILAFALVVLVVPAVTAAAQTGGIGGRVVNPDPNNPRSQSIFIYTLERGQTKSDQLLVMNRTDQEETITLGSVDGVVTNSGDYTCRQEAEPVEDSGGWVKLEKTQLTLPAGGEEKVNFTVTVPDKADVGEHNSCLTIFQTDQGESDEENAPSGVRIRMRQAIRMIVTIPGELKRDISIEKFTVDNSKIGTQSYALTAANKGNVSADVYMKVHLDSIFNNRWFSIDSAEIGGEYPVVPDESLTKVFTTDLKPLFGGWYKVTPSLRFDKRLGAFGTSNQQAEYQTIAGEQVGIFFWPTTVGWIIIILSLVLILAIIMFLVIRTKKRRNIRKSAEEYEVKKHDTIQSLAEESQTPWQEIARLNKISAPYLLKEGQKILLPNPKHHSHPKKRGAAKKKKG